MARALRLAFEDALYHLYARGNRRERIFLSERDYLHFENILAQSVTRYQVELHCYVLLPNHFHLLASTLKPNVSRWMHWLITNYSVWFNRQHRLSGHVFQGRYKALLVQEGGYLLELSRYIHLNPVRGTVLGKGNPERRRARLRSYRWSSYAGYAGLGRQQSFVTQNMVLNGFRSNSGDRDANVQYRMFVEEGLLRDVENPFERVRWQSVLGDESFAQRFRDRFASIHDEHREVPTARRAASTPDPTNLIDRVARHYRISRDELTNGRSHGSEPRNVAVWLVRQKTALTLREIGMLFGGIDYAAISQRIRRVDQKIASQKRLRAICQMLNV